MKKYTVFAGKLATYYAIIWVELDSTIRLSKPQRLLKKVVYFDEDIINNAALIETVRERLITAKHLLNREKIIVFRLPRNDRDAIAVVYNDADIVGG